MSAARNEAMDTQPHHHDIVPPNTDGDVIFKCKDGTSFLVASAVLRLGSKFFKKQLDGPFREAQVPRSVTNPQRIELAEENPSALHHLLCLLHHQRDPYTAQQHLTDAAKDQLGDRITAAARRFKDLAVVIDYYECFEPLERVISSLLNDFATPSIRDNMTFTATVHAASAAYKLGNARHFRLFTKRLVTDFTEPLDDADFGGGALNPIVSELSYTCTKEDKHATQCKHREHPHGRMHELDPLSGWALPQCIWKNTDLDD